MRPSSSLARTLLTWLKLCQTYTSHTTIFTWWRSDSVSRWRLGSLLGAMEQQLGAVLQGQQLQQKMLEMMNHFVSVVLSEKSEKKTEQLDWRAMGEMQWFKGRESEWVDWKFKFLNAVGSRSLTMRKVMSFAEENTEEGQGATCEQVIQKLEALPGTNDHLEGTCDFVKEMSGKIYNHLVKICSDEAFSIVRFLESGDGVEASVKLHQKCRQHTMSRMMRVLMECIYPKEGKGS